MKTKRNLRKNSNRANDQETTNLMNPSQENNLSAEQKRGLFEIKCSNLFSVLEPEAIDESVTKCNELIIEKKKRNKRKRKRRIKNEEESKEKATEPTNHLFDTKQDLTGTTVETIHQHNTEENR